MHDRYVHKEELGTKHTVRLITAEIGGVYDLPSVKDRLIQNVHKQSHSFTMHSLFQMGAFVCTLENRHSEKLVQSFFFSAFQTCNHGTTCNHERTSVTDLMLILTNVEPEIKINLPVLNLK